MNPDTPRSEAERVLGRLGINAFRVPAEDRAGRFHAWMRVGFALYRALQGWPGPRRQILEPAS